MFSCVFCVELASRKDWETVRRGSQIREPLGSPFATKFGGGGRDGAGSAVLPRLFVPRRTWTESPRCFGDQDNRGKVLLVTIRRRPK